MPVKKRFAEKLAAAIKRNWHGSQATLAASLGLSAQSLSQYLAGSTPKPFTIYLLSVRLRVPLEWLLNENDPSIEPPANVYQTRVRDVPFGHLVREIQRQYDALAPRVAELINRAETVPWEPVGAWLLATRTPPKPTPVVAGVLELFKQLHNLSTDLHDLGPYARPGTPTLAMMRQFFQDETDPLTLEERMRAIREGHPGVFAAAHYLTNFDPDFAGNLGRVAEADDDWDDRRAWLMAQLVTHETLAADPLYEPIRDRLRAMSYIDQAGKARDFGTSSERLGDFALPDPL